MKNIGKVLKTSHVENKNFKQELYGFLRNYRQIPHSTIGMSPSILMFSRQTESKLPSCISTPSTTSLQQNQTHRPRQEAENERKCRQKEHSTINHKHWRHCTGKAGQDHQANSTL
ncbi:GDP-mannose-4,6-dehydratase [Plakobranchus ocellatus]|uniref:GDP-mannose-4,6-dehydratase n=1 Tax=Plakobranchus ocellatus TaxID=259542 RepID=A0AAV3ZSJ6_9GAST|nr:GDP-mannose-4,6-dehydratase [Plakobranchus ocellatus]